MAFYFRRGRRGQFKHIAHGLIPAATIAPKSAVPRTPSPRSPYPSPERPRSALAAAILVTTLTGRTVAIPQPRQRSLSESDTSYLQDQEKCTQPYATVTELRMGPNWKSDGDDERTVVRAFEVSDSYCDDEEIDTFPSDTEKEPEPIYQVIDKEISDTIYAIPHKDKQGTLTVSSSGGSGEEDDPIINIPSCLARPDIQVEELKHFGNAFKVKNKTVDTPLIEKPPPSQDAVLHKKQGERFKKLKEENWHLSNTNQTLSLQLEETNQQTKELQIKVKKLEEENGQFKENVHNSHDEENTELLLLRQQAQGLVDENDSLKMTIHRLNVELSYYQTKYRSVSPNESVKIGSLPLKKPVPPWLLDMKYLSPLMLAYEDRLREKEEVILAHEEDMKMFKARVEEVVTENEELHKKLSRNSSVTDKEWQLLQSQAKLVIEENTVLIDQLKIQEAKTKESFNQHVKENSRLTKQLMVLEGTNQNQEEEMRECQKQLDELRSTYTALKVSAQDHITAEEHVTSINKIKSQLQEEQEKRESEVEDLMRKLTSLQAENKGIILEKNELIAVNKVLEDELKKAQKMNRQLRKKVGLLKQQLEDALAKEVVAHEYLANLISLAENATQERDRLFNLVNCLEKKKDAALNKTLERNIRLVKMEETMKEYEKNIAGQLGNVTLKMTEQVKKFAEATAQYQRKIKCLQHMVQEKQEMVNEVLQQKKDMEDELEVIWESTTKENRTMKELLHKSLEKKNTQSPIKACAANISQKDLLDGCGFSYCEMEVSSPCKTTSHQELAR